MPEVRLEKVDGRLFSGCEGVACRKGVLWISSIQLGARMAGNQGAIASEVYFSDLEKNTGLAIPSRSTSFTVYSPFWKRTCTIRDVIIRN